MKVIYTLKKDGTVEIDVEGGEGENCKEATREIEKRLGQIVGERKLKPEFHEKELEAEREIERNREHS